jgi:hypothetical protein
MSDTDTQMKAPQPLSAILERAAMPLLWFSGSLCALLFLSWMFILPRFTGVARPDGTVMSPRAVSAYTKKLTAEILEAEKHRTMLVRAVNDEGYRALVDARAAAVSPLDIEQELRQAAARLGEREAGIVFTMIDIDGAQVTVEGDVRNAGTRSMTVLAAFIDAVAQLPMITDFERPAFTRETLPDGSMHSPFRFTFTLPSA